MQREMKDQDHIQPPLYIKDEPEEVVEETLKFQENRYSTLSEEEVEEIYEEDLNFESHIAFDDEEIDEYCNKFTDLMRVELHKKYDLRSRTQHHTEEQSKHPAQQSVQKDDEKGKKPLRKIPTLKA